MRLSGEETIEKLALFQFRFDRRNDLIEFVNDKVVVGATELGEKIDEGLPEAVSVGIKAVE